MVNPFTGQVEVVRVEVLRRDLIHWNGEPVSALKSSTTPGRSPRRTWVRSDGVILRQEVPFPFVRLVLEHLADAAPSTLTEGAAA